MAFELPSNEMVRRLGADLGMDVSEEYAREFLEFAQVFVPDFRLVERLPDEPLPVKYPRTPGYRPEPADNPWNAWYVRTRIQGAASGRLAGKRLAIKDNVCIAGVPMMNGASILEGYVPDGDATIVTRILDAGGEIVGKSVCEYFSFSGGSATSATGPVISPRNPGHTPGGSTTGSAALLVAGEVDLAIGADQAGSIRIPASFSGIVGLKPTFGLVPYTGIMGLDYTIDHAGPMARDVAGCALLLEAIAGEDGIDGRQRNVRLAPYTEALGRDIAGLRIGAVRESFGLPESHPGTDAAVRAAIPVLEELGAVVEEVSIPWHRHGMPLWGALANEGTFHTLMGAHGVGRHGIGAYPLSLITALSGWRARANELPHTLKAGMLLGYHLDRHYQGRFYAKAQNLRRRLRREYDQALAKYDLLLMPTLPFPTLPIPPDGASLAEVLQHSWTMLANTSPFDLTGHPAISVPCGETDGKPVGLMLVGRHFDEMTVLRAAHAWERR
ncbi:MAG: amidase [Burkholderiales bacterium]|nr:amidase [Burkholderiales bacterium]OJX07815.1 MAG: amidase [Burkholderiales bacterium 70-64]